MFDISFESSVLQTIHMKYESLPCPNNNNNKALGNILAFL